MAREQDVIAGQQAAERLSAARKRLDLALGKLESAIGHAQADATSSEAVERQIQHLSVDRGMLAEEIDSLKRRNRNLLEANTEALARLDTAIETVSGLLGDTAEDA